jgi:hypothetical protein
MERRLEVGGGGGGWGWSHQEAALVWKRGDGHSGILLLTAKTLKIVLKRDFVKSFINYL